MSPGRNAEEGKPLGSPSGWDKGRAGQECDPHDGRWHGDEDVRNERVHAEMERRRVSRRSGKLEIGDVEVELELGG